MAGWQLVGRRLQDKSPRKGGREGEARARGAICVLGAILVHGRSCADYGVFPPMGGRGAGLSR